MSDQGESREDGLAPDDDEDEDADFAAYAEELEESPEIEDGSDEAATEGPSEEEDQARRVAFLEGLSEDDFVAYMEAPDRFGPPGEDGLGEEPEPEPPPMPAYMALSDAAFDAAVRGASMVEDGEAVYAALAAGSGPVFDGVRNDPANRREPEGV